MDIIPLPALRDNYIWVIRTGQQAIVVDPGEAAPVRAWLAGQGLALAAILLTHHHADHVGGVGELVARFPATPVHGPADEGIDALTHPCRDGDRFQPRGTGLDIEVLAIPGHTRGHLAYRCEAHLFCGDTLFSAGCGRNFEAPPEVLHASLTRLAALPDPTLVYCSHEYTLANLAFAQAVEPDNPAQAAWLHECRARRAAQRPTLPTTLARERALNPFLRCHEASVVARVSAASQRPCQPGADCFAALRAWKNVFQG